jgi:hypothetical protein
MTGFDRNQRLPSHAERDKWEKANIILQVTEVGEHEASPGFPRGKERKSAHSTTWLG